MAYFGLILNVKDPPFESMRAFVISPFYLCDYITNSLIYSKGGYFTFYIKIFLFNIKCEGSPI